MRDPLVITIVLNTNRCGDTLKCLHSLYNSHYDNHRVIVLDNGSINGSLSAITTSFPNAQIHSLTRNRGYAGNNNIGIKMALSQGADWIFILNEDTVIAPDTLTELVKTGEQDKRVGVVGPMVYHHDEPNVIQSAGGMLGTHWESIHLGENEIDHGQFPVPRDVQWISGCGIMIRREAIEEAGMIDERYFYYWEETEWCIRIRKRGWRIVQVPHAKMWHKGVRRDYHPSPSVTYYATRNRLFTMMKHRAPLKAWVVTWEQFFRTLASWTVKPKWQRMQVHRNAMARGLVDFIRQRWGQMPS